MPTSPISISNSIDWSNRAVPDSSIFVCFCGLSRGCLFVALIAAPWFFGGVATYVQFYLYLTVLAALLVWILGAVWQSVTKGIKTNRLPLALMPLVGAVVLGNDQLSPYRDRPSPQGVMQEIDLASSNSDDENERQQLGKEALIRSLRTGQSICPAFTRFDLARLTVAVTVFFLGSQLFATARSQFWLWAALALNGAALSFFGLAQALSWNGKLFWFQSLRHGGLPFASFVNRNNAAGYLGICLAAALGFVVSAWSFSNRAVDLNEYASDAESEDFVRHRLRLRDMLDKLNEATFVQLFSAACIVLIATGIVASMSRGGWLALGVAVVFTALVTIRSYGLMVVGGAAAVGVFCAIVISLVGLDVGIGRRFSQAASIDAIASDGRWIHWRDSINAARDFSPLGTGFGTYQFAYLPYQTDPALSRLRFYNADNLFMEWLVEGGWVGMSLVLASLLLVFATSLLLLKRLHVEPVGLVGTFAVVNLCVSSFFDFGPTMTANMLAIAVLLGSIAGRAAYLVNFNQFGRRTWGLCTFALYPSVLVPLLGIGFLISNIEGVRNIQAASPAHSILRSLPALQSPDELDEDSIGRLIQELSEAVRNYPDDPDVNLALAELWVYKFRLGEYKGALRQFPSVDRKDLWARTHLSAYYHQINSWERTGQLERIEMFLENPSVTTHLVPAYDLAAKAEASCVLAPDVDLLLAMLEYLTKPEIHSGESHLRKALLIGPASPKTYFWVGQLAMFSDLTDFWRFCLKKSLTLSPEYLMDIHRLVSNKMSLDEEFEHILPESGELYIKLAMSYAKNSKGNPQAIFAERAVKLLSSPGEKNGEADRLHYLAIAHLILGNSEASISEYRQALALLPNQLTWRLELTGVLLEFKGDLWALREAETCAAIAPEDKRVKELVQNLLRKRDEAQTKVLGKGKKRS